MIAGMGIRQNISLPVLKELSRYVSRYDTYSAEAIEIPHHAFKFTADNVPIPTGEDSELNPNSLERLVIDMETGQRGFQLTDEERFLEPWEAARVAFPQVSSDLVQLAAVPSQDRRARQIRAAITSYVNDYSLPLVAALRRGEEPAPIVATGEGKRRADAIRRLFDDFFSGFSLSPFRRGRIP